MYVNVGVVGVVDLLESFKMLIVVGGMVLGVKMVLVGVGLKYLF